MRFSTFTLGLLAVASPLVAAWSKEDREIFRIRDEVLAHEEPGMTFYDVIGVTSTASYDEITKAHRKKSRSLHPDKIKKQLETARAKVAAQEAADAKSKGKSKKPQPLTQSQLDAAIREATERQARLTLIANILKGPERDRYDHFLKNGFPVWKGTEYYYNRYRPGLGTVLVGLFFFGGGGIHYLALYMGWRRQREFIERYIKFARETAWGADLAVPDVDPSPPPAPAPAEEQQEEAGPPAPTNRRERRMQEKYSRREAGKETSSSSSRKPKKAAAAAPSAAAAKDATQQRTTGPTGVKKRVVAENGKVLVVDSLRDVYVEGEDEDGNAAEFLLDPDEIPRPTIHDTLVVRVPKFFYTSTIGRFVTKAPAQEAKTGVATEEKKKAPEPDRKVRDDTPKAVELPTGDEDSDAALHTPATDSAEEFELVESIADKARASGAQPASTKAGKRKPKRK